MRRPRRSVDEQRRPLPVVVEQSLEFCREDECVEVTPVAVRLRKVVLDQNERAKSAARARRS